MFYREVCDEHWITLKICENVLFLLTGYDNAQGNMVINISRDNLEIIALILFGSF